MCRWTAISLSGYKYVNKCFKHFLPVLEIALDKWIQFKQRSWPWTQDFNVLFNEPPLITFALWHDFPSCCIKHHSSCSRIIGRSFCWRIFSYYSLFMTISTPLNEWRHGLKMLCFWQDTGLVVVLTFSTLDNHFSRCFK